MLYKCLSCWSELESLSVPQLCKNCGATDFSACPSSNLGKGFIIAGFKLINRIGFGGMGEVWLAEQTTMGRLVALKVLHPDFSKNPNFTNRFINEIKHSAKLDHPNIVTAFDAGVYEGIYYLASAYIKGKQLQQKLTEEKIISEKESLNIALGISKALAYAWNEFNILHRDIKPANIIIDLSLTPKLLDLGVAKTVSDDNSLTIDGDVVGTPHYISPEQAKSENLDFRADIYSLGATLYHITTGVLPFEGPSAMSVLAKHITDELIPPIEKNPGISPALNNLIIKMMEKNKDNRHQSWEEVIFNIEGILEGRFASEQISIEKTLDSSKKTLQKSTTSTSRSDHTGAMKVEKPTSSLKPIPEALSAEEIRMPVTPLETGPSDKENIKLKVFLFVIFALLILFVFILAEIYEKELRMYPFIHFILNLYDKSELLLNGAFSKLFAMVTGKELIQYSDSHLRISWILYCYFVLSLILFSAFWSASLAEKYLGKLRLPYFLGGLIFPIIFPFIAKNRVKFIYIKDRAEHGETSVFTGIESKGDYKYNLFRKIAKSDDGSPNGPFTFELTDDSLLVVEKISEVKHDQLTLDVRLESGNIKKIRVPYSSIKTFSSL